MFTAMITSTFALFLLSVTVGHCQTPVPYRPPGFVYQAADDSPKVIVEAFYDHLCDDSMANWPTLQDLKKTYTRDVTIMIHIFPLPYHHNAYFVQQAGEVVRNSSTSKFETFVDVMFKYQNKFLTGAVQMTEPQVKSSIAELTEKEVQIDKEKVMDGFDDDTIVRRSRYAWKYAAHRGITGTPQFIINGVHNPDAADFSIEEWKKMIDQLMATP